MKKNRRLAFLALGFTAATFSCTQEKIDPTVQDDFIDTEVKVPEISFELSGSAEKLHNDVTLTVSGKSDEDVIDKVAFFLNDQPLGEDEEAPYEFLWNTREEEDGPYALKAIAYNEGGEAEASQEVVVKNTLLVINIENGYNQTREGEERDAWIYLSDKNGNALGEAQQAVEGSRLVFYRPTDFNSDTIYLNRLNYDSYFPEHYEKPYKYLTLITYPNFSLSELHLKASPVSERPASLGLADVTVENDFDGTRAFDYATELPNSSGKTFSAYGPFISYSFSVHEESVKGISTYETSWYPDKIKEREKYIRLDDFEPGKKYNFHTSEYKAMNAQTISIPFSYESMMIYSYGYLNNEEEQAVNIDFLSSYDGAINEFMFFSTDLVPVYYTNLSVSSQNKRLYTSMQGKAPDLISMPDISASITQGDGNNILTNTQGTFDIGSASWQHYTNTEAESYAVRRILYFSNQSDISYAQPEVPAKLLEQYPELNEEMEHQSNYLLDNSRLTTYNDIIKYWFTDEFSGREYGSFTSLTIYPEKEEGGRMLEGARMSGGKDTEKQKEQLEEDGLRARGLFRH
jgi:hypothetical protein